MSRAPDRPEVPSRTVMLKGAALAAGALATVPGTAEAAPAHGPGKTASYTNPLILQRADPHITEITGDPLHDPNRHTRIQRLGWKPDGTPDFGVPDADTVKES